MSPGVTIALAVIAALSGGGASAIVVKRMSKPKDDADIRTTDINNLRSIISELRSSEEAKSQRIEALERRMALIEERERHALTRAAVHEAWDQMAFAMLLQQNPAHPPPPPLTPPSLSSTQETT